VTAFLATTLFPLLLIVAGAGDALSMRISNRLNLLIAISFFPIALAAGMPLPMIGLHLATGLALLAAGYLLFSLRLFGGGDAKLMAAAGLWLGFPAAMHFLIFSVLAGGALALVVGAWSLVKLDSEIRGGFISRRLVFLSPDLPYGIALAIGGILAFSQSWWM
jgi:prepilin peptidase CpaA